MSTDDPKAPQDSPKTTEQATQPPAPPRDVPEEKSNPEPARWGVATWNAARWG